PPPPPFAPGTTLSLALAEEVVVRGYRFASTDAVKVVATGAELANLAFARYAIANIGGASVTLDASDDNVVLNHAQVAALLASGSKFAPNDVIRLSDTGANLVSAALSGANAQAITGLGGARVLLDATDNAVTLNAATASALLNAGTKWDASDTLTITGSGSELSSLDWTNLTKLGGAGLFLDASDNSVTLTVAQANLLRTAGVKFHASDSLTLVGTGAELAGLTPGDYTSGLRFSGITLDASDNKVSLTMAQADALITAGVKFAANDQVFVSGRGLDFATLTSGKYNTSALGGASVNLDYATTPEMNIVKFGAGDDIIRVVDRVAPFRVFIDGGAGTDTVVISFPGVTDLDSFTDRGVANNTGFYLHDDRGWTILITNVEKVQFGLNTTVYQIHTGSSNTFLSSGGVGGDGNYFYSINANKAVMFESDVTGIAYDLEFYSMDASQVLSGASPTTLVGTRWNDQIVGTSGADTIHAGKGMDYVLPGAGNDAVYLGSANDVVYVNASDLANDTLDGGTGSDWLHFGLQGGAAINYTLSNTGNITGFENLYGSTSADSLYGDGGNNQIRGGGGDDVVYGNAGNDFLYGDDGMVFSNAAGIAYNLTNAASATASGNDVLNGGDGRDVLVGGAGNDTLLGGLGDDYLVGGMGKDSLTGGAGFDRFVFLSPSEAVTSAVDADVITDFDPNDDYFVLSTAIVNGSPYFPTGVTYNTSGATYSSNSVTVDQYVSNMTALPNMSSPYFTTLAYTDGANQTSYYLIYDDNPGVNGATFLAKVEGTGISSAMSNVDGVFWIDEVGATMNQSGTLGNATVQLDLGGNDTWNYSLANASHSALKIYSPTNDPHNDLMVEGSAANAPAFLSTSSLNLIGGVEQIQLTIEGSNQKVVGWSELEQLTSSSDAIYVLTGDSGGTAANDTLSYASNVLTNAKWVYLFGGGGDDSLTGGAGVDRLYGGGSNDSLLGGAGNDSLFGGAGNDTLQGGDGMDLIHGGTGQDTLYGNAGADFFRFELFAGEAASLESLADVIVDFTPGEDRIEVSDYVPNAPNSNPLNFTDGIRFAKFAYSGANINGGGVEQAAISAGVEAGKAYFALLSFTDTSGNDSGTYMIYDPTTSATNDIKMVAKLQNVDANAFSHTDFNFNDSVYDHPV
ncbi:MAG: hypothetical protein HQL96_13245, partial [Magnetococcales bacterium]|nr:hypothetical protein [Magnetococcales bacterium]